MFTPNHALAQKMAIELLALRRAGSELMEVARAWLDYIDVKQTDIADGFDTMRGFNRDWAEEIISEVSQLVLTGEPRQ